MMGATNSKGDTTVKWTYHQGAQRLLPWKRAMAIVLSIITVSGGVSFAALASQDKLTGNKIQTATANLQLSVDGINYANTQVGFSFADIVPGGLPVPTTGYEVYVKNSGTTPLALKFSVVNTIINPDNVDLTKVHVILEPIGAGAGQNFTLQSLADSYISGGLSMLTPTQLGSGSTAIYRLRISMESNAVNGPSATISNLDFTFSGVVVSL